MKNLLKISS